MEELFHNLGINGKLLLAQAVNFLLLFFILQKFVFKRLFVFLDERKKRIEKGLELTTKAEHEMQRIADSRHRELENARKAGEEILAENKTLATKQARDVANTARAEAEKIMLRAKSDAETAKQDALVKAKEEMREAVLMVSEKILARSLTKQDEERLAKEALGEIEKLYAKS